MVVHKWKGLSYLLIYLAFLKKSKRIGIKLKKTHRFSLFNDEGNAASIDEPVTDYQLKHLLKL
jgi:hypothetical protein